jgi:hypothetical protein
MGVERGINELRFVVPDPQYCRFQPHYICAQPVDFVSGPATRPGNITRPAVAESAQCLCVKHRHVLLRLVRRTIAERSKRTDHHEDRHVQRGNRHACGKPHFGNRQIERK